MIACSSPSPVGMMATRKRSMGCPVIRRQLSRNSPGVLIWCGLDSAIWKAASLWPWRTAEGRKRGIPNIDHGYSERDHQVTAPFQFLVFHFNSSSPPLLLPTPDLIPYFFVLSILLFFSCHRSSATFIRSGRKLIVTIFGTLLNSYVLSHSNPQYACQLLCDFNCC